MFLSVAYSKPLSVPFLYRKLYNVNMNIMLVARLLFSDIVTYVYVSFSPQSEDRGTHVATITIILILFTVAAAGIFLLIDRMGHEHSHTDEAHSKVELYIAISLILTGSLGIGIFFPYAIYWFFVMLDFRCRRLYRRRSERRVTPQELNV